MRIGLLLAALGVLLGVASAVDLGSQGRARAADLEIEADNYFFCDASFQGGVCEKTVNVGDTVTWKIEDGTHTVTQCDNSLSTCPPTGGFDAGLLSKGQEFSHVFNTAGTFAYRCNVHPNLMRGRVIVLASATATPTPSPAQTAAPSATSTPTPAAAPTTGGPAGSDGPAGWAYALTTAGVAAALAGGALALRSRRIR